MSIWMRLAQRLTGKHDTPPVAPAARLDDVTYNDAPHLDRFVFVGGLHRSGTTLLERTLAARYELSYLRATVPESEGQHMQSVYRAALHYGGPGKFAFSSTMRADLEKLDDLKDCRGRIIQDWSRFVVGDSPVLLEKSPPNLTKIAWLRKVFPGSRFVIMTRDPRAASAATLKWAHTSLDELMRHWDAAYTQAMADFSDADCILLRYEDLCADPEAELTRVAGFLNLTPRTDIQEVESRHLTLRNSNAKYIELHEGARYGAGIWDQLGYEL
ncbi:sulfotransferase family protein [Salipiger abyssi]|uniref:sulfotransferase family protein n=1 Tax=Salipiger abyssi TaxID=1250539 RepID=UPI001A8F59FB|nr:sulfotransferase [Salipiger abyssi]MBN9890473.1 sulfotransferase [Salipiger abyssi]